jgi:hypothetical protein
LRAGFVTGTSAATTGPVDQQRDQMPALLGLGVEPWARPRSTALAYSGKAGLATGCAKI